MLEALHHRNVNKVLFQPKNLEMEMRLNQHEQQGFHLPTKMKYSVRSLRNYEDKRDKQMQKKGTHTSTLKTFTVSQAGTGFQIYGKNGKPRCPQVSRSKIRWIRKSSTWIKKCPNLFRQHTPKSNNKTKFPNSTTQILVCKLYDRMDELYDLNATCEWYYIAYDEKGTRLIRPLFKAKCLGEIKGHRAKKSPDKQWVNFFEVNRTRNIHESMLTYVDINSELHRISWEGRCDGIQHTEKLVFHNTNTGQQHIQGSSPAGNCMQQRSATYFVNTRVNSPTLYLCQNDNNKDIRHRNVVKYMHQSVRITGLDQPIFAKIIETIAGVQNMFAHHVDKNNIIE